MCSNICVCEKIGLYKSVIYYRDMLYDNMFTFMVSRSFNTSSITQYQFTESIVPVTQIKNSTGALTFLVLYL